MSPGDGLNGRTINWEQARERLEASQRSLAQAFSPSEETREKILRERAQSLAARSTRQKNKKKTEISILAFTIGQERFGLPLPSLSGVIALNGYTAVPGMGDEVLGVINTRGKVWTLLDFAQLIGISHPDTIERGYVLLLRCDSTHTALMVDQVERIHNLDKSDIVATEIGGASPGESSYATGIAQGNITLLNAKALCHHLTTREGH